MYKLHIFKIFLRSISKNFSYISILSSIIVRNYYLMNIFSIPFISFKFSIYIFKAIFAISISCFLNSITKSITFFNKLRSIRSNKATLFINNIFPSKYSRLI